MNAKTELLNKLDLVKRIVEWDLPWEYFDENKWKRADGSAQLLYAAHCHEVRMCHPNRNEVEAGIKAGREWEFRWKATGEKWEKGIGEPNWVMDGEYRLAPEPEYVKLGPDDVLPYSLIRRRGEPERWHWRLVSYVDGLKVTCADRGYTWEELDRDYEINDSLPRTGVFDAAAWRPCRKLEK